MVDNARDLYRKLRFPGYKIYVHVIRSVRIKNSPVTIKDVKKSMHIYGLDVAGLKQTISRRRPETIGLLENTTLASDILKYHKRIMVSMDYVYVHGLAHLHTISRVGSRLSNIFQHKIHQQNTT